MLVLLAGCTSGTKGQPQDPVYDFQIFLCSPASTAHSCGGAAANSSQIDALRSALSADPDVLGSQYLSAHDTYLIARHVLPSNVAGVLNPGDLPPEIWVDATDGNERSAMTRYAKAAGVDVVQPCPATKNKCSVAVLRQVGIVH